MTSNAKRKETKDWILPQKENIQQGYLSSSS
jgi:hypothetical protein